MVELVEGVVEGAADALCSSMDALVEKNRWIIRVSERERGERGNGGTGERGKEGRKREDGLVQAQGFTFVEMSINVLFCQ